MLCVLPTLRGARVAKLWHDERRWIRIELGRGKRMQGVGLSLDRMEMGEIWAMRQELQ